jgi:hypothetical protein
MVGPILPFFTVYVRFAKPVPFRRQSGCDFEVCIVFLQHRFLIIVQQTTSVEASGRSRAVTRINTLSYWRAHWAQLRASMHYLWFMQKEAKLMRLCPGTARDTALDLRSTRLNRGVTGKETLTRYSRRNKKTPNPHFLQFR